MKRDGLFDALKRQGLPTRRVETFHYTDLKALLRALPAEEPQAVAQAINPLVAGAHVLNVLQGVAQRPAALPDGVSISLYRDALTDGAAAEGLTAFNAEGGGAGQKVTVAYSRPGLSLSHVWFKSGYPLPVHSHDVDCFYQIFAGSMRIGSEPRLALRGLAGLDSRAGAPLS